MDATPYGIPCNFLTDRRTIFTYKKKNPPALDEDTYSQFSYAYNQLRVELESVFEEQPSDEKINLTLATLCERTIDTGHCLRHNNNYYKILDITGMQVHYRKGTKT